MVKRQKKRIMLTTRHAYRYAFILATIRVIISSINSFQYVTQNNTTTIFHAKK